MSLFLTSLVFAQNPWEDASYQDLHGYARALSLDLRAEVLTPEELLEIESSGEVSQMMIEEWLQTEGFTEQVIRQHQALVWNNIEAQIARRRRLATRNGIYYNPTRYNRLRGSRDCGTFEAEVNEYNQPLSVQTISETEVHEGYVMVEPYWDMENPIPVCAYDAQTTPVSASGVDCSTEAAHTENDCGCGPNLIWCYRNNLSGVFLNAFEEEVEKRVIKMLNEELSYEDFLLSPFGHMNGPMVHFFKYLAPFDSNISSPVPIEDLPDLDYTDEEWVELELPDHSAGLFSSSAWLLRHQTNRGRANRLYGGFLCREFIPVEGEIEGTTALDTPSPDLSTRAGCRDCHARLDPWAAYWGRWKEGGLVYYDAITYPSYSAECTLCSQIGACPDYCDMYTLEPAHSSEDAYVGWFSTYSFLIDGDEYNPDLGPTGWVDSLLVDESLAKCSASNAAGWLLGWEYLHNEEAIDSWAEEWSNGGLHYRDLVRLIVSSEYYWRGQ